MHVLLALTLMHDRHLSSNLDVEPSAMEAYHLTEASAIFQQQLSTRPRLDQQAALWTTSAMLGIIVFGQIEATAIDDVWPLKSNSVSDVDWMKIGRGKAEVFRLTEELRDDPTFKLLVFVQEAESIPSFPENFGFNFLPDDFVRLFGLDHPKLAQNNPYRPAIELLAKIMRPQCQLIEVILSFWSFTHVSPELKALLEDRDPLALLLLAYWYMRATSIKVWWLQRRTILEGQAICIYLERYHRNDPDVQAVLALPKMFFNILCPIKG